MTRGLERLNIVMFGDVIDRNANALTGDYVNMKKYQRLLIVNIMGDGTGGNDAVMTLYQAKDVAGGGAKVLPCLVTGRIWTKEGANIAAVLALTGWTKATQATASETWLAATSGESVGIHVLEVLASDLDAANGFCCVRVDMADPGAAKIIATIGILLDPPYAAAPEDMADPLTD